jgi:peroxiredoxin Q/BCP
MRWLKTLAIPACVIGVAALIAGGAGQAQEKKGKAVNTLKAGDKAPVFESIDDQGKPFKSTDVVGKKVVVLFFYPAALTGG